MKPLIAVPAIALLVYRAVSKRSLTPAGVLVALVTAVAHAWHPWSVYFVLLAVFFLAGTAVTKVKHAQKMLLTLSSSGGAHELTNPSPRTPAQVLCNSLPATLLILAHLIYVGRNASGAAHSYCLAHPSSASTENKSLLSLAPYGIFVQYAAVAADTFSSELGILSTTAPFLLPDLLFHARFRRVPRGTNGGVTFVGLLAGLAGAMTMAVVTVMMTPFCAGGWETGGIGTLIAGLTVLGTLGSVLDSVLGGTLQASVVDVRAGKVVEGDGGVKVAVSRTSKDIDDIGQRNHGRKVLSGHDILSNNGVNLLMATCMSICGIFSAWAWAITGS